MSATAIIPPIGPPFADEQVYNIRLSAGFEYGKRILSFGWDPIDRKVGRCDADKVWVTMIERYPYRAEPITVTASRLILRSDGSVRERTGFPDATLAELRQETLRQVREGGGFDRLHTWLWLQSLGDGTGARRLADEHEHLALWWRLVAELDEMASGGLLSVRPAVEGDGHPDRLQNDDGWSNRVASLVFHEIPVGYVLATGRVVPLLPWAVQR